MSNGQRLRALLDTEVLRAYRRGESDAIAFIADRATLGRHDLSQLSAMILLADATDAHGRTGLGMFFQWCDIHAVTAKLVRRAQQIIESLAPPCGLTADDAVVAATAIEQSLPLYTLDPARFAGVAGLTATRPY